MRAALLYNPRILCERLAAESTKRRRLAMLRGTVAAELRSGHIDSLELLQLAREHEPRVIYDIGANVGTWSRLVRACFPGAVVHAFEPLDVHCRQYERLVRTVPDMFLHEVALGAQTGTATMNVTSFSDASSLLALSEVNSERFQITKKREECVRLVVLDHYVTAKHLPLPDLIKLDVQGYELEALRGAESCLKHASAVICEVSFVEIYDGQPLFHDIENFLHHQGFHLEALGVNTRLGEKLIQTDALFTRRPI